MSERSSAGEPPKAEQTLRREFQELVDAVGIAEASRRWWARYAGTDAAET